MNKKNVKLSAMYSLNSIIQKVLDKNVQINVESILLHYETVEGFSVTIKGIEKGQELSILERVEQAIIENGFEIFCSSYSNGWVNLLIEPSDL